MKKIIFILILGLSTLLFLAYWYRHNEYTDFRCHAFHVVDAQRTELYGPQRVARQYTCTLWVPLGDSYSSIVFFSPDYGMSADQYTQTLLAYVAQGAVVVALNHTYINGPLLVPTGQAITERAPIDTEHAYAVAVDVAVGDILHASTFLRTIQLALPTDTLPLYCMGIGFGDTIAQRLSKRDARFVYIACKKKEWYEHTKSLLCWCWHSLC